MDLLSGETYFVYREVTLFNEVNIHLHNRYYLESTVILIRRTSSIIDEYIYSVRLHDVK